MMNDWRDHPYTYENNNSFSVKVAAVTLVALGFVGLGTFAYETSGSHSQIAQTVASNAVAPQGALTGASASAGPGSSDLTSPESPPAAAPLTNAAADSPPVTTPAGPLPIEKPAKAEPAAAESLTNAPNDAPPAAAPARLQTTQKSAKVTRAQRETADAAKAQPEQVSANTPAPKPAEIAPAEAAPAAAQAAPPAADHSDAAPQEVKAPVAADPPPQQAAPATDSAAAATEAAPQ